VQENDSIEGTEWGVGNEILKAQLFPILYVEYQLVSMNVSLHYSRTNAIVLDTATLSNLSTVFGTPIPPTFPS
jgi:hypothetical protein